MRSLLSNVFLSEQVSYFSCCDSQTSLADAKTELYAAESNGRHKVLLIL